MSVLQQLLNLFCFHSLLINDCHFFDLFKVLPVLWIFPALWIMRQVYSLLLFHVYDPVFFFFVFPISPIVIAFFFPQIWSSFYSLDFRLFAVCFRLCVRTMFWNITSGLFTDKCISLSIQPLSWHHRKSHHKWMGKKIQIYCICHGAKQMTAQTITTIKPSMVHSGVLWQLWSPTSALLTKTTPLENGPKALWAQSRLLIPHNDQFYPHWSSF